MILDQHIETLLHDHECVIIPDFGGFLLKNSPAKYVEQDQLFSPPSSQTQFHTHLRNNDGLLIQSIMKEQNLSYNDASRIVADYTNNCKQQLKESKSIIINGVGKIYLDKENKIQFRSNTDSNFNENSFGLLPVNATKINRLQATEKTIRREVQKRTISPLTASFTAVASIVALFMASALFFLHNGNASQKEFVRTNLGEVVIPVDEMTKSLNQLLENRKSVFNKKENIEITKSSLPVEDAPLTDYIPLKPAVLATVPTSEADFHVIVGMFNTEENAQKRFQETLKAGYSNTIVKKGVKYYRVMVPFTKTIATWTEAVDEVRENVEPEAWIWETLYRDNQYIVR